MMDIDNFYWVAVSNWGGIEKMAIVHCDEEAASFKAKRQAAQSVRDAAIEKNGEEARRWARLLPVALFVVEHEDIDEVTVFGPQLLVMGQPVSMVSLGVINLDIDI